jgi:hypothetical protein
MRGASLLARLSEHVSGILPQGNTQNQVPTDVLIVIIMVTSVDDDTKAWL